ncbi:MAG: SDR family NAD(P)-dependent oxidoreductase [Acidobacteria bacterium]|nr:SDR family NAD(P)-dependent oxidoreductase [Acidobacteriota bacterium]
MQLENTSALVTGGASGLGEATVRALAARGARVVVVDLNEQRGHDVATSVDGRFVACDVTDTEQVIAAIAAATALAPLRSVVNCAGIAWAQRTVGKDGEYASAHDLDLYRKIVEVNLIGTFNVCRLGATAMGHNEPDDDGGRGAIVNTASVAARDGQIGQAAYSSSKGGIVGLTLPLARDLAAIGVRANCVLPGLIDTPIYDFAPDAEGFKATLAQGVLFPKRLGRPAEFASLVIELLTNSYMNAECVRLDAGVRLPPK